MTKRQTELLILIVFLAMAIGLYKEHGVLP